MSEQESDAMEGLEGRQRLAFIRDVSESAAEYRANLEGEVRRLSNLIFRQRRHVYRIQRLSAPENADRDPYDTIQKVWHEARDARKSLDGDTPTVSGFGEPGEGR